MTDACVVLGYLDPAYFLGGEMRIDRALAEEAIRRDVAEPLGLDVDAAAAAILDLACERMVTAIEQITLNQGLDPREAVTVGGGGGAGLYAASIARRLGTPKVVIPAVSAALSAAGALLSELTRDVQRIQLVSTRAFDFEAANATLDALQAECEEFIAGPGADAVESTITFSVEARYPNQVWEIEVPLPVERFAGEADVRALERAFHRVHEGLFAFADETSEIEIVAWRAQVRCRLHAEADVSAPADGADAAAAAAGDRAAPRTRPAYFSGHGVVDTGVYRAHELATGDAIAGPAIVESPATNLVVPPGATVRRLASGSLLLDPGVAPAGAAAGVAANETEMS